MMNSCDLYIFLGNDDGGFPIQAYPCVSGIYTTVSFDKVIHDWESIEQS